MVGKFQTAAEAFGATVKRFDAYEPALAYVKEIAKGPISASPLPDTIRDGLSSLGYAAPSAFPDTKVAVSIARAGIAETGSLLIDLSNPVDRSATSLAQTHIVFLNATNIVPSLYDLTDDLNRSLTGQPGTYISITTGPSRTADIERVLTIGVHGPKELHILILEGKVA